MEDEGLSPLMGYPWVIHGLSFFFLFVFLGNFFLVQKRRNSRVSPANTGMLANLRPLISPALFLGYAVAGETFGPLS